MKPVHRHTLAGLVLAIVSGATMAAAPPHPSTTPLPDLGAVLADTRRALVIEVHMQPGSAQLLDLLVSDVPPGTFVGDPAQLQLRWLRSDGSRIGIRNAHDPLLERVQTDTGELQEHVLQAAAVWNIPFSPDIHTVTLTDLRSGQLLLEIDASGVVQAFCADNPGDPNCQVAGAPEAIFADGFEDSRA